MTGGHEDAGADGLLSNVIFQNLLLDQFHDVASKKTNHCQIHASIHQTERIASGDDTIKGGQILESPTDNLNLRIKPELPAKDIAEFLSLIYENQSHL